MSPTFTLQREMSVTYVQTKATAASPPGNIRRYNAKGRNDHFHLVYGGPIRPMKIAILGTRGIPARYGGFETFAEELAKRLARDGHDVVVYCRRAFAQPTDVLPVGVRRVILPGLSSKHFDTLWHTGISSVHVTFGSADVVLICNVANSLFAWIPRMFGKPTVLNVDGLDRKRKKWNIFGRTFLLFCEAVSVFTPSRIVTDSLSIQRYYRQHYHCSSSMIAYGAEFPSHVPGPERFQLTPGRYLLYVSRLEPENNPELVIRAYREVATDWPLVVVGGNSYHPEYPEYLKSIADPRVMFTGAVYGEGYWTLQRGAALFISGCEVGGTHPTLLEAMAAGTPILYLDKEENRETVADAGIAFQADVKNLAQNLTRLIGDEAGRAELAQHARLRAAQHYSWDTITSQYEELFEELLGRPRVKAAQENR
jgi:glycosyltransferase involved in cell wall biosynthesis